MTTPLFANVPDVCWLMLPHRPVGLELCYYETPFGQSDELLCYFEGTLLGLVVNQTAGSDLLISLLPKFNQHRLYAWPKAEQFRVSLSKLLDLASDWRLRVEHDADQSPVSVIQSLGELDSCLSDLVQYCIGVRSICPNFQAYEGDVHT